MYVKKVPRSTLVVPHESENMYAGNGPPSLSSTGMDSFTNEGTNMMEASNDYVYVQPPSYSGFGHGHGQATSHNQLHDSNMHRDLAPTDEKKAPSFTDLGNNQGNSYTHDGNANREGDNGQAQAPSYGALTRGNVSQPSGGVDSYTGDQAAPPSHGAVNKRESSQTAGGSSVVFEGADVQEFVGMSLVGKNFRKFYPNAYYKEKDADN